MRQEHPGAFVVAVDAVLGRIETVGTLAVAAGALRPGVGVGKDLPEVGHLRVTGTVNVGGFMEYLVLQNTRLHVVASLAEVIADGIAAALAPAMAEAAAGRAG